MPYRCLFETRYRAPAKIIWTTIVIDLDATDESDAKAKLLELWPHRPGVLPAKHHLRITPTTSIVYHRFQDYSKRPRR